MNTQHSIIEHLIHCTVRIECDLSNNSGKSTGTGFIFEYLYDKAIPFIVTNKHVIKGSIKGRFCLTLADNGGNPCFGKYKLFEFNSSHWILHPQSDVDLCIMPLVPFINQPKKDNANLFLKSLDQSFIPTQEDIDSLTAIEDIIMIGYPNGIWDSAHNLPIVRKGITATHPKYDYCNKGEFMVDIACFPGSSGSPVFLYNSTGYTKPNGDIFLGEFRVKLLGVLYAGPQHTATGEIKIINVPTGQQPISISRIPNNLGLVIKSEKILDFEKILKAKAKQMS